jgi:dTDP-4-dehydrorhamnose reductase
MKILLFGRCGQIGREIYEQLNIANEIISVSREECNFNDEKAIENCVMSTKPDLIINAAAYTNVDLAEDYESEVFQINALAPGYLAQKANLLNIPIVHFSTDYVFDGKKNSAYNEEDRMKPLSVYAYSKCEGENLIRFYQPKHFIIRTSRVFSSYGDNFIKKIIKLSKERETLSVVNDQYGTPTSARWIGQIVKDLVEKIKLNEATNIYGIYHVTLEGSVSWWDYVQYIVKVLNELNVPIKLESKNILPVTSESYFQKAPRPNNVTLDVSKAKKTFMLKFPNWKNEVKNTITHIVQSQIC